MKKKIIFALVFFSIIFFGATKTINAACGPLNPRGLCNPGEFSCHGTSCCASQQECSVQGPSFATGNNPTTGCDANSINTAIGCVPVLGNDGGTAFMGFILKWAVGIGGGIAFLLILYGGFMIMTSAGNPERLKAGQELLTSAISGLILLILSIFILKLIGIDILGLGAFGFGK